MAKKKKKKANSSLAKEISFLDIKGTTKTSVLDS